MHLLHLFDLSLKLREREAALEWNGAESTFGDLELRSNRMANALRTHGFAKGDRLCVQLANRIELIDLYLACVKLGVIFVPINVLYREREVAHIVSDAEPRLVITDSNLGDFAGDDVTRPDVQLDGSTPAAIIYTSGTTGTSKGAVLTHDNFAANAVNLVSCWQITDRDRFFLALPLFHIHALGNGLHTWLLSGCRMRLVERFDHRSAVEELRAFAPTLFFGVPTIYVRLLDTPIDDARAIGAAMRLFVSGSAPLPPHVLERFRELFGHVILERYGMTETFMNTSNPYVGERRAGTVGFPLPGVSVRIEEGELLVRGPNVFAGYWRRPDATAAAFTTDGYFRTGDMAAISKDGYITLIGRKSDLIISGGFNIYPREIEELLLEQPGVSEAAVVGVADDVRGEVPVAYLVGDVDEEALAQTCREQLASFKVPRKFVKVDSIPRTALGKVQKHLLRLLLVLLFFAAPAFAKPLIVHVTVALCDNATQGIVPVPPAIGDGNDPRTNLYWGAMYGVKSQLKREKWTIEKAKPPHAAILERLVARKTINGREVIMTADAWRGSRIRDAITAFLEQASGANADIVAYIGHDGLMEFDVTPRITRSSAPPRSIVLACASRQYFAGHLRRANSQPLLWTTGLMAPEAYTLTAAIEAWVRTHDPAAVREAAAQAYHKHQKCGIKAARRLFRE